MNPPLAGKCAVPGTRAAGAITGSRGCGGMTPLSSRLRVAPWRRFTHPRRPPPHRRRIQSGDMSPHAMARLLFPSSESCPPPQKKAGTESGSRETSGPQALRRMFAPAIGSAQSGRMRTFRKATAP